MNRPTFALALFAAFAPAQQFVAETDPSPPTAIDSRASFPTGGTFGWFAARQGSVSGLYRTDGTAAGTVRVFDGNYAPRHAHNGVLLFTASNVAATGTGLFRTDGTVAGTAQLLPQLKEFVEIGTVNGRRVFADHLGFPTYNFRIYGTDTTTAGTTFLGTVKNLQFGTELNGELLISARSNIGVWTLYATDGIAPLSARHAFGVSEVPNSDSAEVIGNDAYLVISDLQATGVLDELWRTDGTTTTFVTTIGEGSFRRLGRAGNLLLITGDQGSTETLVSDGTAAGTTVLTTAVRGNSFFTLGNQSIFAGWEPTHGGEIWRTDGTAAGTVLLLDATPGSQSSNLSDMAVGASRFYCCIGTNQLLATDGTVAGTAILPQPVTPSAHLGGLAVFGDTALVCAPIGFGREMLATDGTSAGTAQLAPNELRPGMTEPFASAPLGDELCFVADNGLHGRELWRTDGTAAGTMLVEDIAPGPADAVGEVVNLAGELWFGVGGALYRSNGTAAGRTLVVDTGTDQLLELQAGKTVLSFQTPQSSNPPTRRLWRSDGTTTIQSPLTLGQFADSLQIDDATYYVSRPQGSTTLRLFHWQGEASGGLDLGQADRLLGRLGERALFLGPNGIMITDGTAAGTSLVGTLLAGFADHAINRREHGTFFVAVDVDGGVHASTGGALVPLTIPSTTLPMLLAGGDDFVYLQALDPVMGRVLYRTDGTSAGTSLIADFGALPDSRALAMWPLGSGNRMLLSVRTDEHGIEPWITDGTSAGTMQLADLAPTGSSHPVLLGTSGDKAYFVADDGVTGPELWRLDLADVGAANVQQLGVGCAGSAGRPRLTSGDTPTLGSDFAIDLDDALPNTIALWFLGFDVGFAHVGGGCNVYFQQQLFTFWNVTDGGGRATGTLTIPGAPALLGASLIQQAGVFDPLGASPFGTSTTQALLFVIGG